MAKEPRPSGGPKSQAIRQAINKLDQKKAALGKAASQLQEAERWPEVAQDKHDKALEEAADAEEEHEAILRAYSSEAIPSLDEATATEWKAPEVDPTLFDNLDDYEPEDKNKLLKFRSDLSSLAQLLESAPKQEERSESKSIPRVRKGWNAYGQRISPKPPKSRRWRQMPNRSGI